MNIIMTKGFAGLLIFLQRLTKEWTLIYAIYYNVSLGSAEFRDYVLKSARLHLLYCLSPP